MTDDKKQPAGEAQYYPSECPMSADYQEKSGTTPPEPASIPKGIDPNNMMPPPNQRPSPDQPFELDTARVTSSIPKYTKANENDTHWRYPSPQMFWNAMLRKGWRWKDDEPTPEVMNNIVSIHNVNNERAWREVLMWEQAFHADECPMKQIKLKKFSGKAKDLSWKATIRNWMGYDLPFDRHDWIIDRCGQERTYVIDYYDGPMNDETYQFSFLDVRPHPRNINQYYFPEGLADRFKASWRRNVEGFKEMLGVGQDSEMYTSQVFDEVKAIDKSSQSNLGKPIAQPHLPVSEAPKDVPK